MATLLRPTDLNQIPSDAESAKMDEERALKKKKEQQQIELREAFMERHVHPEVFERINQELRPHGYKLHAEIISFPGGMPGDAGLFLKW